MKNKSVIKVLMFGMCMLLAGVAIAEEWKDRESEWLQYAGMTAKQGKSAKHGDMDKVAALAHKGDERAIFAYYFNTTYSYFGDGWADAHSADAVNLLKNHALNAKGKNPILDTAWAEHLFWGVTDGTRAAISCDSINTSIDYLRTPVSLGYVTAMKRLASIYADENYAQYQSHYYLESILGKSDSPDVCLDLSTGLFELGKLYVASHDEKLSMYILFSAISLLRNFIELFLIVMFIISLPIIFFRIWRRSAACKASYKKFLADFASGESTPLTYTIRRAWFRRNFYIDIDRANHLITVNRKHKFTPGDFNFSNETIVKTTTSTFNIGGQMVWVPAGGTSAYNSVGNNSAYVPAQSTGRSVHVPGREYGSSTTRRDAGFLVTIIRRTGNKEVLKFKFFRLEHKKYKALADVLTKTRQWCDKVK